jgi:hypothetical protein
MTCGDASNAWVPSLVGSVWSGTVGEQSLTVTFVSLLKAAASVVGAIPAIGTWSKDSAGFHWTAALEGYTWLFTVTAEACNEAGDVTAAVGSATDGLSNTHPVSMTRTI